jgi:hypothetical protein
MTDTTQAATFVAWLTELLSERRQLCSLLQSRQRAKLISDLKAVRVIENRLCELVLDPLNLRRTDNPNPTVFVDALAALPSRFASIPFADPARVFDTSLTPGLNISLVPALRARMLDLCGDLDSVIARKRQATKKAA